MKILLVAMNYAPERSGTAPYTAAWAAHMAQEHQVAVLAGPPHYPEWRIHDGYGGWTDTRTELGVRVRRLRHFVPATTSTLSRLAHEFTFVVRVLTQRIGSRPDVVVAVSPPLFGVCAAALVARRFAVPFGVVVQDIYSAGVRELGSGSAGTRRAAAGIEWIESKVLHSADKVLTIHDRFAATLQGGLGFRPADISVVGNWVHIPQAGVPAAQRRAELGWGNDYVILHAGNMGAKQGLETAVEAARLADRDGLGLRYVLMGDGNQRPELERLAAGLGTVQFLPAAESADYANILAAADLLLICERPGVAEMSLPSKLTSYCATGRPILAAAGASGATAAALAASSAGLVVPPGDPAAMNAAALALAADPQRCAELGRCGLAFADEYQSAKHAMAGYDRWIEELLGCPVAIR